MRLSIVVPCHHEADILRQLHQMLTVELQPITADYELILVDDGSSDGTVEVIQCLARRDSRVRYLTLSRNFGKEAAMLAGLEHASGEAVILMDADLQHPPELISGLVERYRDGVDQVIARRTRAGDPRLRSATARLYYHLINRLVDVQLEDGVGDFRLLSRRAVDALLRMPEVNRFSKGMFSWIGFDTAIIEYENAPRAAGTSSWTFRKLFNYGIDGLISFNNKPLRMSIYLGLAVTGVCLLYILFVFTDWLVEGTDAPGYPTLISAVLFLGGLQLLCLGLVGEYIGRIYYETKRRPHYLVKGSSWDERRSST